MSEQDVEKDHQGLSNTLTAGSVLVGVLLVIGGVTRLMSLMPDDPVAGWVFVFIGLLLIVEAVE